MTAFGRSYIFTEFFLFDPDFQVCIHKDRPGSSGFFHSCLFYEIKITVYYIYCQMSRLQKVIIFICFFALKIKKRRFYRQIMSRSLDIVIIDADETFVRRLAGAISDRKGVSCNVRAFSETEKCIHLLEKAKPDALIVGREIYGDDIKRVFSGKTIVLTPEEEEDGVCRFSPVQTILEAVGDPVPEFSERKVKKGTAKVTGVFSFCETAVKNAYALALAKNLSYDRKVLYINTDEFSGLGSGFDHEKGLTLSDAIYAYRQEKTCGPHVKEVICTGDGFDYIPPTACADDLTGCSTAELNTMINEIMLVCGYESVVIDSGYAISEPWNLYKICDEVDIPYLPDVNVRMSELKKYMLQSGKSKFFEILRQTEVPADLEKYSTDGWMERHLPKWCRWLAFEGTGS